MTGHLRRYNLRAIRNHDRRGIWVGPGVADFPNILAKDSGLALAETLTRPAIVTSKPSVDAICCPRAMASGVRQDFLSNIEMLIEVVMVFSHEFIRDSDMRSL